jgi:hypothetical protein
LVELWVRVLQPLQNSWNRKKRQGTPADSHLLYATWGHLELTV